MTEMPMTTTSFPMQEGPQEGPQPSQEAPSAPSAPDGPPSSNSPPIPPPVTRRNFFEVIDIAEVEVVKGK